MRRRGGAAAVVLEPASSVPAGQLPPQAVEHYFAIRPNTSIWPTSNQPPGPWPEAGMMSAKPISSTLDRSILSTGLPLVTTLAMSSLYQRASLKGMSSNTQSLVEAPAALSAMYQSPLASFTIG